MTDKKTPLVGQLVDSEACFTLLEMSEMCGLPSDDIVELVQYGILETTGESPRTWAFSGQMLVRSKKALRLRRDLELNLQGLALCLDLLDEVEDLRRELKALRHHTSLRVSDSR